MTKAGQQPPPVHNISCKLRQQIKKEEIHLTPRRMHFCPFDGSEYPSPPQYQLLAFTLGCNHQTKKGTSCTKAETNPSLFRNKWKIF